MTRRSILTAAGLFLIALTGGQWWIHSRSIEALFQRSAPPDFVERNAKTLGDVRSELDPAYASALMARALLADALDTSSYARLDSAEERFELQTRRTVGLEMAQQLALETVLVRPSHWQAAMVLGGATYLERSIKGEPTLFTEARRWEAPLEFARTLAPSQPEPTRFMTMAYLEVWPVLSRDKRSIAQQMVSETFEDEQTFVRAIRPWLSVQSDLEDAFELLPDRVFVWQHVQSLMAEGQEWHLCAKAHERLLDAMWNEYTTLTARAIARIEGGDRRRGRDRMLGVFQMPPSRRFSGLLSRSFGALPAGPVPRSHAMSLSSWVLWENDRCLYGRCVFEPTLMERLANATVSELDPVDAARALLSFDDLASAERAEQQFSSETHSKDWAPYYLQKVPRLLERQEIAKAISALAAVHDEARSSPAFLLARMAVEEAAGDRQGFLEARADVTLAARDAWRPSDWRMSKQNQLRLQLLTAADAKGITVDWLEVHNSGGAVSLFVDGRRIGTRAIVNARSMSFQFLRPLPAGLHLLEIQRVAGRVGVPGSVKLIAAID